MRATESVKGADHRSQSAEPFRLNLALAIARRAQFVLFLQKNKTQKHSKTPTALSQGDLSPLYGRR